MGLKHLLCLGNHNSLRGMLDAASFCLLAHSSKSIGVTTGGAHRRSDRSNRDWQVYFSFCFSKTRHQIYQLFPTELALE
jgi:hypothetical protein